MKDFYYFNYYYYYYIINNYITSCVFHIQYTAGESLRIRSLQDFAIAEVNSVVFGDARGFSGRLQIFRRFGSIRVM